MRDDIWYREELLALLAMVEEQIHRSDPADLGRMVALGGLHEKLSRSIDTAPSAATPEASA